jgi:beta-lactam-binding protein with PASTA domain
MPNVQRMETLKAVHVLESYGFENITVKGKDTQDPSDIGVVMEQVPDPGQDVLVTDEITIMTGDPKDSEGSACMRVVK